jgi:prevent-host-death family protein
VDARASYVGIRELKARATEIVRQVRETRAEYVITHRGRPAALIVPIAEPDTIDPETTARLFADIDALAEGIGRRWPAGVSAVDAVREVRRDV